MSFGYYMLGFGSGSSGSIPVGLIVGWEGTIANIPSGWYLADGTNGTPDLTDTFVIAEDNGGTYTYNSTGGSSSEIVAGTTNTTGSHLIINSGGSGTGESGGAVTSAGDHSHATTFTIDNSPPNYSLAYIMSSNKASVLPSGCVLWFNDSVGNIPTGYSEKTELQGRFIKGTDGNTRANGGSTVESVSVTFSSVGEHNHLSATGSNAASSAQLRIYGAGAHTHPSGPYNITKDLPQYHALTAIKSTGSSELQNKVIAMYYGNISEIPNAWNRCDGTNSTPNLSGKFVIGQDGSTYTLGGTGGTASRTFTNTGTGSLSWSHGHASAGTRAGSGAHSTADAAHEHTFSGTFDLPSWKSLYYILYNAA